MHFVPLRNANKTTDSHTVCVCYIDSKYSTTNEWQPTNVWGQSMFIRVKKGWLCSCYLWHPLEVQIVIGGANLITCFCAFLCIWISLYIQCNMLHCVLFLGCSCPVWRGLYVFENDLYITRACVRGNGCELLERYENILHACVRMRVRTCVRVRVRVRVRACVRACVRARVRAGARACVRAWHCVRAFLGPRIV